MKTLVTGSSGHLGEALVRTLRAEGQPVLGVDISASETTDIVGDIADSELTQRCMQGVEAVLHTATLHKPHVATHSRQAFIDTNITGTLNLLTAATEAQVSRFVFTSTTSTFGDAMKPSDSGPAVWVNESLAPLAKNIYGASKCAAEDLCRLFARNHALPCVVLRTSRFFPEADDNRSQRNTYDDANLKVLEFLHRRVAIEDVVDAHRLAVERAPTLGFDCFIISATTPFQPDDADELRRDAPAVIERRVPGSTAFFEARGWRLFSTVDRIYDNRHAREVLGWQPRMDFASVIEQVQSIGSWQGELAQAIGAKGYHDTVFEDGPFPVEE